MDLLHRVGLSMMFVPFHRCRGIGVLLKYLLLNIVTIFWTFRGVTVVGILTLEAYLWFFTD